MPEERIRDYIVENLLGRGGMGSVYLARHIHLGTMAALKVLHEQYSDDPSIKSRFINEARLLHELRHSNIVEQREFFEENGRLVLVMEYVDGRGLDEMIGQETGPIAWEKALPLFVQILEGIGYAHSKGIIHRDIKPANILISKDGKVKITDLGIAKIAGQKGMTRTGTQMGTLYYESPEQIRGAKNVDHRSDIYSLGITLYEMLAGRLPFDTEGDTSEFQIMNSIVNRENQLDPRDYYPHIPEWLVKSIQKVTNLEPKKRFQTCKSFKQSMVKHGNLSETESSYWSSRIVSSESAPLQVFSPVPTDIPVSSSTAERCPTCEAGVDKTMKFCDNCGEILVRDCPECKGQIRWNKNFCPECGIDYAKKLAELKVEKERRRLEKEHQREETRIAENKRKQEIKIVEQKRKEEVRIAEQKRKKKAERLARENEKFFSLMQFVKIPSGNFMMGTPPNFMSKVGCERPYHRVDITSFELLSTSITQAMWVYLMGTNPSHFTGLLNPVENVSWDNCQEFIRKLNKLDLGYQYRLPSEAEWEYACRADTMTEYHWGDGIDGAYCWYNENSKESTHPVGQNKPNTWGLFDMSGSVWELCQDTWHSNYKDAPIDGSSWESLSIFNRVIRGGSWYNGARGCRSVSRSSIGPGGGNNSLGFRLARFVL